MKFRLIPILLIISLITSFSVYADGTDLPAEYGLGDVNKDAIINAQDALQILKHAAKLDTVDKTLGDVDADGSVSAADALMVLKYAADLINSFPGDSAIESETPIPSESESPVPTETGSPVPTETPVTTETMTPTGTPVPTETVTPTATPVPTETVAPTTTPVPTETVAPTTTPAPLTGIDKLKSDLTENGYKDETGSYMVGYGYEDNLVKAIISYSPTDNVVTFSLTYEEESADSELMNISITMKHVDSFKSAELYVEYQSTDFQQYYKAVTDIIPEEITAESKFEFTETDSLNCTEDEIESILEVSDLYMQTAFNLWDDVISREYSYNLKDIGFTNYIYVGE